MAAPLNFEAIMAGLPPTTAKEIDDYNQYYSIVNNLLNSYNQSGIQNNNVREGVIQYNNKDYLIDGNANTRIEKLVAVIPPGAVPARIAEPITYQERHDIETIEGLIQEKPSWDALKQYYDTHPPPQGGKRRRNKSKKSKRKSRKTRRRKY